jgi:hypothetical protein
MEGQVLLAMLFTVAIFSGVFLIFLAMRQRSETLERQHRERMAMIERGQVPPAAPVRKGASSLAMSIGIIVVGFGLGLMMLIGIAADQPEIGVGVGGAIVIIGAAFIVRSLVVRPTEYSSASFPPPPPRASDDPR